MTPADQPKAACPSCGQPFDPAASNSIPFCSPRCRQIDLSRWLNEKQSVPVLRRDEDEETEAEG